MPALPARRESPRASRTVPCCVPVFPWHFQVDRRGYFLEGGLSLLREPSREALRGAKDQREGVDLNLFTQEVGKCLEIDL